MLNLPKGVAYMGIAVVAGLVATFAVSRYVAHKTYVPPVLTGKVAVATTDIAPGNALAAGAIKIVSWPKALIPPQAASASNQVEGRVAIMGISTGEPIIFNKLAPVGTAAGLSSLLGEHNRAMTVRVDDVSGVAGFIHPRDKVDVLADMKMRGTEENFSKTILQNIMVLSTGQTWVQTDSKPKVVNTVTLEVTPEQAELLNLASSEGKIRLALRSRLNDKTPETSGVLSSSLFAAVKKAAPAAKEEKEKKVKEDRRVEVIKGMQRSKLSL
jgi:pilus assembly protein CpaB